MDFFQYSKAFGYVILGGQQILRRCCNKLFNFGDGGSSPQDFINSLSILIFWLFVLGTMGKTM